MDNYPIILSDDVEDLSRTLREIIRIRNDLDIPSDDNMVNLFNRGILFGSDSLLLTADTTLGSTDGHADVNATSGVVTVTLSPNPIDKQRHSVAKIDASGNAVTVDGGALNINGAATDTLSSQYDQQWYMYVAVSDEWRKV